MWQRITNDDNVRCGRANVEENRSSGHGTQTKPPKRKLGQPFIGPQFANFRALEQSPQREISRKHIEQQQQNPVDKSSQSESIRQRQHAGAHNCVDQIEPEAAMKSKEEREKKNPSNCHIKHDCQCDTGWVSVMGGLSSTDCVIVCTACIHCFDSRNPRASCDA